jgi:hypothetical protein
MKHLTKLAIILPTLCFVINCFGQSSNIWIQKANFGGTARSLAVSFNIGTKGYIGTGKLVSYAAEDFWEYDPSADTWSQKANVGGGNRFGGVGFSIGTKGYIGTGIEIILGSITVYLDKKDFWEYDPSANTWTQKNNFGGTVRSRAVGFSIGSKGYIGTGYDANLLKDFWEYDPSSDTWTQKTDFGGTPRQNATGFSIGTKGYIGTGSDGNMTKDFWEYDPSTDTWTQKTDFGGTPREGATGLSIGTKGYIGTGVDPNYPNYSKDFWEYDPSINTWTQRNDVGGTARAFSSGFGIGTKGYIGTGEDGSSKKSDFWEYSNCSEQSISITSSLNGCNGTYQTWYLSANPTSNGSNWQWTVDYLSPGSDIYIDNPNSPFTYVDVSGGGVVRLTYTDLCGATRQDGVTVYSNCENGYAYTLAPNPTSSTVSVFEKEPASGKVKTGKKITELNIYDKQGNLKKHQKYNKVEKATLDVSNLKADIYILEIVDGTYKERQQLSVIK